MKRFGLAILALSALTLAADAGNCRAVRRAPAHRAAVRQHAAPVALAAVFVPVLAVAPAYTASYGADPTAALAAELQKLREEVQQFRGQGLTQPAPSQPAPREVPAAAAGVQTACASCHTGAAAKGGFVLFDDKGRAKLTDEQVGDAVQAVLKGDMPRGKKLSADEKLVTLKDLFDSPK